MISEEDIPLLALSALSDEFDLVNGIHPALQKADANALSHIKEPSSEFGDFGVPEILTLRQTLGWVLYLDPLSKSEIESVAKRLAFPSSLTQIVQSVIVLDNHMASPENWRPSQWTFFLDDLPPLSVYAKFLVGGKPELHHYLTTWRNIHPFTSGNDLKNRGLVPGPKFKEILTRLRAAWLDGEVENEEDEKRLLGNLIKWY
jgi:tRNA nucleotidyltransferase (CCA-adding enzyme)